MREAVRQAGEDYALPAACQGRASPVALDWLARACPDRKALPVATGAFRAVWCLGVLCTTSQRLAFLAELRRVLADGGDLGLLVFERHAARLPTRPRAMTSPPRPSSTGRCATRGSSSWTGFPTMSCRPRRARGASGPIACKL
jgi:SAM-dependent methyltransferase